VSGLQLVGLNTNFFNKADDVFGFHPLLRRAMSQFFLRRFVSFVLTLLITSVIVFLVLEWLPGNAAQVILGETATQASLIALEQKLGLDQPASLRYLYWVGDLLRGQTQLSISYDTPTAELIVERMAVTLPLAGIAMVLTVAFALGLGIFAASHRNTLGDVSVMALSQMGLAMPSFWVAIVLILIFAVKLGWVSAGGFPGWTESEGGGILLGLKSLLLPTISLAAAQIAILARVTRSAVLETLNEDYVRTARAKGLSNQQVLWRHVLRNAMIPVVTVMGLQFGNLITGAIVVENVFVLPGLGRLIFQAIANRDLIVVRDVVMVLATCIIAINFIVDLLYGLIDPRLMGANRG
jgi:peptide/nickel transport system permease protein